MDRLKAIADRLLYPNAALQITLMILSALMLTYTFALGDENSLTAYIAYIVSAYTTSILVIRIVLLIKKVKLLLNRNPYAERYINDRELRAGISLAASTLMNILFAVFRIVSGILYHSLWSGAIGGYYIVLSLIRIILMKDVTGVYIKKQSYRQLSRGWHSYRLCGVLMFLLNAAMVGMAVQMIWQNRSYSYPGTMILVSAMYTFYSFTIAIVNIAKFRKLNNPILSAAKAINFAGALMSMFALQTAMFTQFGGTEEYRRTMNIITGTGICAAVMFMAVFMIIRAGGKIRVTEVTDNGK